MIWSKLADTGNRKLKGAALQNCWFTTNPSDSSTEKKASKGWWTRLDEIWNSRVINAWLPRAESPLWATSCWGKETGKNGGWSWRDERGLLWACLEAQHPARCPSPTRGAVCLLPAFGAPSPVGAVLSQGFCLSLFMFLSMSLTVREPYQNKVSLKSGAEIIVSLLGQSCLNQAGNEER